jgi:hypothetical protein
MSTRLKMAGMEKISFGPDAGGWLLFAFALASLGYEALLLTQLAGEHAHGDAAGAALGRGFLWLYAMSFALVTWLLLGVSMLRASRAGLMHPTGAVALAIFIVCGAGCAGAFLLLEKHDHSRWPAALAVLLPLTLGIFTLALYIPSARGLLASRALWLSCAAAYLLLSAAPWVQYAWNSHSRSVNQRLLNTMLNDRKRQENLAKLDAMPQSTPLWDWQDLLSLDGGVRPEALEAVHKLDHRQADVEQMLEWGIPNALALLPELDVKVTPRLCKAANAMLKQKAEYATEHANSHPADYAIGGRVYVEESLPALHWLTANGCDCDGANAALQAAIAHYSATKERKAGIEALAALRRR